MSRELIEQFPNEIIRASAGTGKTFALSNRYLRLLASGAECETILATTFTRKGAGEILDRIIQRLSDAALTDEGAKRLSTEIEWEFPRARAANILHDLLGNLHRLEISTLDSFFNSVSKAFSLELGLPPTWDIVDQQQTDALHDEIIQQVLRDDEVENLLHMITKGEVQRRVADLIRSTVNQIYEIYQEADEFKIWDRLPEAGRWLSEEELDAIAERIADLDEDHRKSLRARWDEIVTFFKNGDWENILTTKFFTSVAEGRNKFGNSKLKPEHIEILQAIAPQCIATFTQRLIRQNQSTYKLLNQFGTLLEKAKDETGQLRFNDIVNRLLNFVDFWETDQFSFRLDHQIQHLLLDEFQDTSLAQWKVIRPFAQQVTQPDSLRSFFCVGDMKQAIYGWRGGVAEIFDLVDDELQNIHDSKPLTASYRSSQVVIDAVNGVFGNLDAFKSDDKEVNSAVHGWANWFNEHTTERKQLRGHVTIEYAPDGGTELRNNRFELQRVRNELMLARTIERIQELQSSLPDESYKIGVLVRTNDEVGSVIFALQQAGIRASEEGGNPLTDAAAVEVILSALTLADHPGDDLARFHVSHSPLAEEFGMVAETETTQSQNKKLIASGSGQLREQLVRDGYGPAVERLAKILSPSCTRRELLRLQHLVRVAYSVSSDNDRWALRPKKFVDFVRDEVKVSDQSSAQVRVMTIHQSKGLEFDVVVLPMKYVTNGWFGHQPSVVVGRDGPTSPVDIACRYVGDDFRNFLPENFQKMFVDHRQQRVREELCNLYVAMTRGVHSTHIILSHAIKPNDKSSGGVITAALNTERQEGVVFEIGETDWGKAETDASEQTDSSADQDTDEFQLSEFYLPNSPQLKKDTISDEVRSGRGLRSNSPSKLEGGDWVKLSSLFDRLDNETALTRGTMIHGCFEKVKWLDEYRPTQQELVEHLKSLDPTMENHQSFVDQFELMLESDSISSLLNYQTYLQDFVPEFASPGDIVLQEYRLEVENERAFSVVENGEILSGFIDRLILVFEGDSLVAADVIDFKSDPVSDKTLGERVSYYRPQLNAYRNAVSKLTGLSKDRISARLAFVEIGKVVIVDPGAPTESAAPKKKTTRKTKKATSKGTSKKTDATPAQPESSSASTPSKVPPPKGQVKGNSKETAKRKSKRGTQKPNSNSGIQKTLWDD